MLLAQQKVEETKAALAIAYHTAAAIEDKGPQVKALMNYAYVTKAQKKAASPPVRPGGEGRCGLGGAAPGGRCGPGEGRCGAGGAAREGRRLGLRFECRVARSREGCVEREAHPSIARMQQWAGRRVEEAHPPNHPTNLSLTTRCCNLPPCRCHCHCHCRLRTRRRLRWRGRSTDRCTA